mmetsp:Transcript_22520/g.46946  ORF Transcript_22520/g.46946 Transcript_22520/m.46946 type:complete len:692 (-) Transcript_22520:396-2471(-)|eukprot:CAMPEP_0172460550 /NCGR_PEP_ID=MMETSP1065-20121228/37302_1 /TAXON_ID=265537 /ORGANISM="Amphiprora paludosa, Strain CCMP125" /LENGTH=691 /DNA_ID=CAMNT_0013215605 /DNA_START=75 /DNA_END=2150 /DNA_ORIENTATION=+
MSYEQVKWKKQLGTLLLDAQHGMTFRLSANGATGVNIPWPRLTKHQVSPVSYPKSLLKLNLSDGSNTTFQLPDRTALEKIRKEITQFLQQQRNGGSSSPGAIHTNSSTIINGKKRAFSEVAQSISKQKNTSYGDLDPTDLAVTRATLLAAHPNLRQQHHYLVNESKTVSEEDFWKTHQDLLEEEYARMSGVAKAGSSSLMQSHVPAAGKVTLGVEEMRQIFILYPAVHKAYEEKVPLSLSDEEFWRKYLESEFFHRDRGRMGTAARNHQQQQQPNQNNAAQSDSNSNDKNNNGNKGPTVEEQDARAAAVSADDLFSRYEQKISESNAAESLETTGRKKRWGAHLAVGQFDLARTLETERGKLLEGSRDNHPPNQLDDGKGAKVIEKYNRHWAMVLHPEEAVAGSNLLQVARRSVYDSLPDDDDAQANGGMDKEMRQLSAFASASVEDANHATGVGVREGENYETLSLKNVEVYYSGSPQLQKKMGGNFQVETEAALAKRHADFSRVMFGKAKEIAKSERRQESRGILSAQECFPPPKLGRELLTALTKKMAIDARTEAASLEMVNRLPDDFRNKLQSYFRRSSELLRHFFGLRRLEEEHRKSGTNSGFAKKLERINGALANFYREMEDMRRELPQTETGEMMRKMCLPIMEQLDWAFKLHGDSGSGGGGGFVDVGGGFVDVGGGFVDVDQD